MKVKIIVNPVSGGGYAKEVWSSLQPKFKSFDYSVEVTNGVGHATEIAGEAVKDGIEYIVCVGGDGTVNEVLQAIVKTDTVIVPISAGTGSDFVKTTNVTDIDSVISHINNGDSVLVDSALLKYEDSERYFINVLEVGFGASVMKRVNSHRKVRGTRSFTSAVFRELLNLKSFRFNIISDAFSGSLDAVEIVVANGRYFGGGMLASKMSSITDGKLDVHIIDSMGRLKLISKLSKLRSGEYVNDRVVTNMTLKSIKIYGDSAPVEMDGECIGNTPAEIQVIPKSVRIIGDEHLS